MKSVYAALLLFSLCCCGNLCEFELTGFIERIEESFSLESISIVYGGSQIELDSFETYKNLTLLGRQTGFVHISDLDSFLISSYSGGDIGSQKNVLTSIICCNDCVEVVALVPFHIFL